MICNYVQTVLKKCVDCFETLLSQYLHTPLWTPFFREGFLRPQGIYSNMVLYQELMTHRRQGVHEGVQLCTYQYRDRKLLAVPTNAWAGFTERS